MPKRRPQKDANPEPVPRTGAGKTSGVHPYNTALNIDWKKLHLVSLFINQRGCRDLRQTYYSIMLRPMLAGCVLTAEKTKIETAISAAEISMVSWRPKTGTLYIIEPRTTATMPGV